MMSSLKGAPFVAQGWMFLVAFCVSLSSANAGVGPPLRVVHRQSTDFGTLLELDPDRYEALRNLKSAVIESFPLPDATSVTLRLHRIEMFAPDAIVIAANETGEVQVAIPDLQAFGGEVIGKELSWVFLALSPLGNQGLIRFDDREFVISTSPRHLDGRTLIYEPAKLQPGALDISPFHCFADQLPVPPHLTRNPDGTEEMASPSGVTRIARVAVETDTEFTSSLFGNDTEASGAYAATLIAGVSEIYERDVSTALQISFLRLWSGVDPWTGVDTAAQLFQFQDFWIANMSGVSRHTAHFLSGRALGGGIAYLGALCDGFDYGLSANLDGFFPNPLQNNHTQNWDPFVVAHELGHNFGAPHTHEMSPPVDNCGNSNCAGASNGTIMSYCHTCSGGMANIRLEFHSRTINETMLPFIESGTSCDWTVEAPQILEQPIDQVGCNGGSALFSVNVAAAEPVSFQWRKGGLNVPGATSSSLLLSPLSTSDANVYELVITNSFGSIISDSASLTLDPCVAPTTAVAGCRYLRIQPTLSVTDWPVALQVTSPDLPCFTRYVDANGFLVSNPVYRTVAEWQTIYVGDSEIVSDSAYEVRVDLGSPGASNLSSPSFITSAIWGDAVGPFTGGAWPPADGTVDFFDIGAALERFKNLPTAPPLAWVDVDGLVPTRVMDFLDIGRFVDAFRGLDYPFANPCQ